MYTWIAFLVSEVDMPELPEVETIARRLSEKVIGKTIGSIEVLREKSFQGDPALVTRKTIKSIARRAKLIRFDFEDQPALLVHLKMTGQLIYKDGNLRAGGGHPTADWINSLPSSHTRVILNFDDDTQLFFNDQRVFGWLKPVDAKQLKYELRNYGPDIVDPVLTPEFLYEKLQKRTIAVKTVIMDNKLMSGVGNIYASDGLNLAKIDPRRPANSLSRKEVKRLLESLLIVINLGIKLGGASMKDYLNIDGLSGGYQNVVRVYGKEGEPCPNCGSTIMRIKQGGRSTFFCPRCQN